MPFNINGADVQLAMQNLNTPSNYAGSVGTGSTTTAVVDAVGGFSVNQWTDFAVQFTKNTTTASLQGVWRQITSNTADTLALASALPTDPVQGDSYDIRPFGQQTLNINSMGGEALPGSPVGTPGSAAPTAVMQVGGSDGTDARTFLMDSTGRTIAAKDLVALAILTNTAANTDFGTFTAPWSGTATAQITPATGSVVNLMAYISSTEYSLGPINSGVALVAGDPFEFDMPISSGTKYAFQYATVQSGNGFIHVKGVAE